MKLYRTAAGPVVEQAGNYSYLESQDWDALLNHQDLLAYLQEHVQIAAPSKEAKHAATNQALAPLVSQEVWAAGVTYQRSKMARVEESKASGASVFYDKVYEAARPELFFKATPHRVVGHQGKVNIRKDSTWNVPEPELTLVLNTAGKTIGYTIGNDMSSRDIEGENPLYLPQAKVFDNCASLGPCILVKDHFLGLDTVISMQILRNDVEVFAGDTKLEQLKRSPEELVSYLFKESSFPQGCFLMTGTCIVPENEFTLQSGDVIHISIDHIGTLTNIVS